MPVHIYRQPWSLDKSASELVCTCVYVCSAPCCVDSDKGGSRGLKKLIKRNDAMWGDSAVCSNQETPSFSQQQEKKVWKIMSKRSRMLLCD